MANHICVVCNKTFTITTRGRPPSKCNECKGNAASAPVTTSVPITPSIPIPPLEIHFAKEEETTIIQGAYTIFVTNAGIVYSCDSEAEANKVFKEFSEKSALGYGQVGFENVYLKLNGEVVSSYNPRKVG